MRAASFAPYPTLAIPRLSPSMAPPPFPLTVALITFSIFHTTTAAPANLTTSLLVPGSDSTAPDSPGEGVTCYQAQDIAFYPLPPTFTFEACRASEAPLWSVNDSIPHAFRNRSELLSITCNSICMSMRSVTLPELVTNTAVSAQDPPRLGHPYKLLDHLHIPRFASCRQRHLPP